MTPQELKNSILQLAVQGKLVEQRPEEGTAEELYHQIQEEKQRLIKEGKIKKKKPLADISEEEIPFEIPDSWKWIRFGELAKVEAGGTPDRNNADYWNGDIPWVKIGDISDKYVNSTSETITEEGLNNSSAKIFPAGTLLYTIFATIGTVGILGIDAATNQAIAGITLYSGIDLDYMYYISVGLKNLLVSKAHGMAQLNINQKILKETPIPLPPPAEQKRIVSKIEELLPLIDRYEQAWTKLEAFNKRFPSDMQKSFTHAAIQGKLVGHDPSEGTGEDLYRQIQATKNKLVKEGIIKKEKPFADITEEEIPFDIPSSWKWVRLGELIKFQGGYAYKSTSYVPSSNNQVVRLGNVKTNNLLLDVKQVFIPDDIAASTEDYLIQADDILVTMTGTRKKRDYFFTLAISENDLSMRKLYLNQRVGCLRPIKGIDVSFLLFVLQSEVIKDLIFAKETGTANQGNIGSEDMKRCILIPLPPLAEQKRIVAKLDELLPLCEKLK